MYSPILYWCCTNLSGISHCSLSAGRQDPDASSKICQKYVTYRHRCNSCQDEGNMRRRLGGTWEDEGKTRRNWHILYTHTQCWKNYPIWQPPLNTFKNKWMMYIKHRCVLLLEKICCCLSHHIALLVMLPGRGGLGGVLVPSVTTTNTVPPLVPISLI